MWFDAYAQLAEIVGHAPATPAPTAQPMCPVSQMSRVSQAPYPENNCVASNVAPVATPSANTDPDMFRHGASFTGRPLTWTGRIVSRLEWAGLSDWEKHGPNGRHWCGLTDEWIQPKETENDK
jgi:hypothetical protein